MELTNTIKKYIRSLHQRKYRQKYAKILVEGSKSCGEVLATIPDAVEFIICTEEWRRKQSGSIDSQKVIHTNKKTIKSLSKLSHSDEILLVIDKDFDVKCTYSEDWVIHLDGVQDPGNVGTIIRIADWFGISLVSLSAQSAQLDNTKVIQATMGSFTRVNVVQQSFEELIIQHNTKPILVADLNGQPLSSFEAPKNGIIVIGNEGKGPQPDIIASANSLLTIPQIGHAESLNASVSCGILCSHLLSK